MAGRFGAKHSREEVRPVCPRRSGKVAFACFEDAKREAGILTWRNKQRGLREKVEPYICQDCGTWHVGRGPKGGDIDGRVS